MTESKKSIGFIDSYHQGVVTGWAVNLEMPRQEVLIDILCGETLIASGKTGVHRPDLEKLNPVAKNQGFSIKIELDVDLGPSQFLTARDAVTLNSLEGSIPLESARSESVESIEALLAEGNQCYQQQKWKEAEEIFKKALASEESNSNLYWMLALTISKLGRQWEALQHYEAAYNLDSANADIIYELAKTYEKMGRHQEAAVALKALCELTPNNSEAYYWLGINLRKVGQTSDADIAFTKAIKYDNVYQSKLYGIGAFHARKGLWSEAIVDYRAEINKRKPAPAALFYRLAMTYEKNYQWREAVDYYEQAIELDCTDHYWHYRLGLCYERLKEWELAAISFTRSADRNEKFDSALYQKIGDSYANANNASLAITAFKTSKLLNNNYGREDSKDRANEGFRIACDYTEMHSNLAINQECILYESYHGASVSCNPYAIFKSIVDDPKFRNWLHVWVLNDKRRIPNELRSNLDIVFVTKDTDLYRRYLCTAKYLINNSTFPMYFSRRQEQVYLNTWHGTPQKTLFKDIHDGDYGHKNIARNLLHSNFIVAPNLHTEKILLQGNDIADTYPGQVIRTGYPRVDLMLNATDATKKGILSKLRANNEKPVVLFAPTYRENQTEEDIAALKADILKLGSSKYTLLFRGHYFVEQKLAQLKSAVKIVPQEIDTCELLSVVDLLVTDYSSIYFDFLPKCKPIVFYTPDYKKYESERGLYFDQKQLPGNCFSSATAVQTHIDNLLKGAVAGAECNTVIELKLEHHAA